MSNPKFRCGSCGWIKELNLASLRAALPAGSLTIRQFHCCHCGKMNLLKEPFHVDLDGSASAGHGWVSKDEKDNHQKDADMYLPIDPKMIKAANKARRECGLPNLGKDDDISFGNGSSIKFTGDSTFVSMNNKDLQLKVNEHTVTYPDGEEVKIVSARTNAEFSDIPGLEGWDYEPAEE